MSSERGAVRVSPNHDLLMATAADLFLTVATTAIAARGQAMIALTGGTTPRSLYQLLATPAYASQLDWSRTQIWFGDERGVGPDDPESNFGMARDALLAHVPLPAANIHRMPGELDPAEAARRYTAELQTAFGLAPGAWPRFDLIWLGMGPDGHTASLFPGTAALSVTDQLCVANDVPHLNAHRITLTFPVLNAAALVAFLVAGEDKAAMVARVLEADRSDPATLLPAQRVAPINGQLLWLLDLDAAGQLHE